MQHLIVKDLIIKDLGCTEYQETLVAMQQFTAIRTATTPDEIWLTEHTSVYTLGINRKNVRLPHQEKYKANIPVVLVDRGGKITYHGSGQVVIYVLLDLKRRNLNVRQLVSIMEASVIELLAQHGNAASVISDAPGVYVQVDDKLKKIASLGLRLKNNCCYHGLSLNVDMDLAPFNEIDPCGYVGLESTQTKNLGIRKTPQQMGENLLKILTEKLI
jgi:lipoyl(octanoyl) transferase